MRRLAVCGVLLAAACNALTGVGDLHSGSADPRTDAATSDGAPPGEKDGGTDGTDGLPPLPGCGSNRVCVPSPPGFTPIVFLRDPQGKCPAEYPEGTSALGAPTSGECRCDCSPVGGSCMPLTLDYGATGSCTAGKTSLNLPLDGGCASIAPFMFTSGLKLTPPATPGPVSCNALVTPGFDPPAAQTICGGATASKGECATGESCVPQASGGAARNCIVHEGDVACPARFSTRYALGDSPMDTRACTACTCGVEGCASTQVEFATNSTCFVALAKATATGTCSNSFFGGGTMISARVTSGGGCKVTAPSTVTGSVTFPAPKTVCCR